MKTTVLVYIDRENTSMGMRIASQEEFTKILIKNKELPLQERRLFTKDVIADTDGLDVMYIETGIVGISEVEQQANLQKQNSE